ncbi:hypothetical protein SRABI27_00977 [Pedobacter sp. Bi27]|uniref:DUF4870 domain-containing protein n=1 Tax=unclassified Pedobacter TaxID=2628915 RepID=UPI001D963F75|nr:MULTISPECIES: DUF4870 domain-containing protein [unclassified Pedobacter]CAH0168931.1 hypothetical protein SRABI126_00979 [Pedobacter sp. Bi126]CAH0169346.1 hypothetical protein SRABI27_00977 [Pedobacter sp. Bi27]CAH0287081.1 hypothetical protein SRABI36_04190 [Pedobacter sp. Bi36]
MNNKTLSIISYITIIGWLVAYFSGKDKADALLKYHLRQSLGLAIVNIIFSVALTIIASMVPSLSFLGLIGYVFIVLWIMGIINAANGALKPVPLIGKMFEDKSSFVGKY